MALELLEYPEYARRAGTGSERSFAARSRGAGALYSAGEGLFATAGDLT
jgi:hypothetical protein